MYFLCIICSKIKENGQDYIVIRKSIENLSTVILLNYDLITSETPDVKKYKVLVLKTNKTMKYFLNKSLV